MGAFTPIDLPLCEQGLRYVNSSYAINVAGVVYLRLTFPSSVDQAKVGLCSVTVPSFPFIHVH